MKGVILDIDTLAANDLDLSELMQQLDDWSIYTSTSPDQLQERIADADVVLSNKVRIDAAAIAQASNLKLIAIMATGSDNIDVAAARTHGVTVCNARAYSTASVAQHTLALILALSTKLLDYNAAIKRGDWVKSQFFCLLDYPVQELAGKTLGLIGYGNLAKKVASMAKAFDMNIVIAKSLTTDGPQEGRSSLDELLAISDVVSIHCPLTAQSQHLISSAQFAMMKPSAFLINTARGGIVDEFALAHALKTQQIAGAAIDVLAQEPPKSDSILLQDIPNLILTPHSAWASQASRQRLVTQLSAIISGFIAGKTIQELT